MALEQTEDRSKIRREKSKEAIALAMQDRWEEAVAVNRVILEVFPEEIEAWNRLGKAFFELREYDEARSAFARALRISPSNAIASRNLNRLSLLRSEGQLPKKGRKLLPEHFLEESGKTAVAALEHPAPKEVLATITAGDAVTLRIAERSLVVEGGEGEYLGRVPPRLALRLIRLIHGGNQYEAAVTRLSGDEVTIIIREVFQHPDQRGRTSFPSRGEPYHPYQQDVLSEFDLPKEQDEGLEAAFNSELEQDGGAGDRIPQPTYTHEQQIDEGAI